jgi:hypothetical protein
MWSLLAAWSFATSRRLFEIGILLAGIGSGFIGLGAVGMILRRPGPSVDPAAPPTAPPRSAPSAVGGVFVSPALIAASVLLVAGFVLMILSVHFGVVPWSPRVR